MINFYNLDKELCIDVKQKYIDLLKSNTYHKKVIIKYHRRNTIDEEFGIYYFYNSSTKESVFVSCTLKFIRNSNKSSTLELKHVYITNKN